MSDPADDGAASASAPPGWLCRSDNGVLLNLYIQPAAARTSVAGIHGDALKIRLAAQPVEGKANEALIAYLAQCLGVARRDLQLVAGLSSRRKRVTVQGLSAEQVIARLASVI